MALGLPFSFFFPFSSKKTFPTKKDLANSLEKKSSAHVLCHLMINKFVFTGNLLWGLLQKHTTLVLYNREGNRRLEVTF